MLGKEVDKLAPLGILNGKPLDEYVLKFTLNQMLIRLDTHTRLLGEISSQVDNNSQTSAEWGFWRRVGIWGAGFLGTVLVSPAVIQAWVNLTETFQIIGVGK